MLVPDVGLHRVPRDLHEHQVFAIVNGTYRETIERAEYERELIVERAVAGLEHARANGRVGGRRPVMQRGLALQTKALVDGGLKPAEIAKQLKVSRATAYRYLDT